MSNSAGSPRVVAAGRVGRPAWLAQVARRRWLGIVCVLTLAYLVGAEASGGLKRPSEWNWLMHSGAAVFLLALAAARQIPPAVPLAVQRIRCARLDGASTDRVPEILSALLQSRRRYSRWGAMLGVPVMGVIWFWAAGDRVWDNPLFWLELVAAGVAGHIVGGFIAYGGLGRVLANLGLCPLASPGHPDGAGGLKPVGALYLRQAMIVALIGAFAGVWWLLIPYVGHYRNWRDPYLAIVVICLVLEAASLFLPLHSFHSHMVTQRQRLLPEADEAALRVATLDRQIWRESDPEKASQLEAERERTIARWQAIETMPTWPVDASIRKRFAWNNVIMLVPLALQAVNAPQIVQQVSSLLGSSN